MACIGAIPTSSWIAATAEKPSITYLARPALTPDHPCHDAGICGKRSALGEPDVLNDLDKPIYLGSRDGCA